MVQLINLDSVENYGERLFIEKVQKYLDDTNVIYWNRQVFGRELTSVFSCPEKAFS